MERVKILERTASILEELNKSPKEYVSFSTLHTNTKLNAPVLTRRMNELQSADYVEKMIVHGPELEIKYKIKPNGQKALARYRKIENIMRQIP